MIPQEIQIEIFLFYPSEELLSTINDKNLALRLLKDLPDSGQKCYFLRQRDHNYITIPKLIIMAVKENNIYLYKLFKNKIEHFYKQKCAVLAAINNYTDLFDLMVEDGFGNWCLVAKEAARNGNRVLLDNMIERFKNSNFGIISEQYLGYIAEGAAEGGQRDTLNYLIEGVKKIDDTIVGVDKLRLAPAAAKGGHRELVYELIAMGSNYYQTIAEGAAFSGDKILLDDILPRAIHHDDIAISAAKGGHLAIIESLINHYDVDNYDSIAARAAQYSNIEIMNRMIEFGAKDWNEIAFHAAKGGNIAIVYAMIKRGATNWSEIAWVAKEIGEDTLFYDMKERDIKELTLDC